MTLPALVATPFKLLDLLDMKITPPVNLLRLPAAPRPCHLRFWPAPARSTYDPGRIHARAWRDVAQRAIARRQEDVSRARAAIESGDIAMKQRDYETAFAQYKEACDLLPESDVTRHLRNEALDGLDEAGCDLAEQRISEGRYQDAAESLQSGDRARLTTRIATARWSSSPISRIPIITTRPSRPASGGTWRR